VAQQPLGEAGRRRLTFRRLSGLDRSGPAPAQTLRGAPLRPWTLPNAIGFVRLGAIPVFLALAFASGDGTTTAGAILFACISATDYLDGIAARVTGQYSRLGALMDPVVDRLLVVSGAVVCWSYALLPRWAIAVLALRELLMLVLAQLALRRGFEIQINWLGRAGVWPVMSALGFAVLGVRGLAEALLYVGLVLVVGSTLQYVRAARRVVSSTA
jgi:CDP-diacylglycerol--glycerol-3-phosphate 3-phosphatidyltransferase